MVRPLLRKLVPYEIRLLRRILLQRLVLRRAHHRYLSTGSFPYPRAVCIDPVNICQLKCPLCPTGAGRLRCEPKIMPLETFKEVVDRLPFVRKMDLFNWGEPLLNPHLLDMLRYAHGRGIKTRVSTNLSIRKDDEFFEGVVNSGLDTLVVSLDGASRESYASYRVGGDFDLVLSNLRKISAARNKLGGKAPEIIWQFIVHKANEHEVGAARRMSKALDVKLELIPIGLSDDLPDAEFEGTIEERKGRWLPSDKRYVRGCYLDGYGYPLSRFSCEQLFSYMVVNPDGKVSPCCYVTDSDNAFGDLMAEPFHEIWNNEKYVEARTLFLRKGPARKVRTVCSACNNFSKR